MKHRSLRKQSMYLVITLAFADMLVGGISEVMDFFWMGNRCNFWQYNVAYGRIWDYVIFNMGRMHATFFRSSIASSENRSLE